MKTSLALALTLIALAGCRPHLALDPPVALPAATEKWPGAKAVVLLAEDELLDAVRDDTAYAEQRVRRVIQIRTAAALREADVRISLREGEEITAFRARSLAPDGTVRTIGPEALAAAPFKKGEDEVGRIMAAAIPGVVPGSVIEYDYVKHSEKWYREWTSNLPRGYPILEARVRIAMSDLIRYAAKVYNSPEKLRVRREGDLRIVEWSQREIGLPTSEMWAPPDDHWPWVNFRVKQLIFKSFRRDITLTWTDGLRWHHRDLSGESDRFYGGYTAPPMPPCPGEPAARVPCVIDAALALSREKAPFDGFRSWHRARPLREVIGAGGGAAIEKAALVSRLLRDAGLTVEHALTTRAQRRRIDHAHPSPDPLDHLVLHLPAQPGLPAPLWIDPACDHCRPGTLPDDSRGYQAIVLDADGKARTATIGGVEARGDALSRAWRVEWRGEGAVVHLAERAEGGVASRTARADRGRDAKARRDEAEKTGRAIDERAQLEASEPWVCDLALGECARALSVSIAGLAIADRDELLVPLSVLAPDGLFPPVGKRTRDLVIETGARLDETLAVPVPAGHVFAGAPDAFATTSDAFSAKLEVSCRDGVVTLRQQRERRRGRYTPVAAEHRSAALTPPTRTRQAHLRFRRAEGADPCGGATTAAITAPR
ncbi:MAG: DUF3857 domain-containing protein [bacterium]